MEEEFRMAQEYIITGRIRPAGRTESPHRPTRL
jgi:hypothetical protein